MPVDFEQPEPHFARDHFIVAIITEPPGALALVDRFVQFSWVIRLPPRCRGRRFDGHTETAGMLNFLHAMGPSGQVFINLPEAYSGVIGDGA